MKSIYYEASIAFSSEGRLCGMVGLIMPAGKRRGLSLLNLCSACDLPACLTESSASVPLRLSQGPRPLLQALSM